MGDRAFAFPAHDISILMFVDVLVEAVAIKSSIIKELWNEYPSKCLTETVYEYQLLGPDREVVKSGDVDIAKGNIVFTGLECNSPYTFRVKYKATKDSGHMDQWMYVETSYTPMPGKMSRLDAIWHCTNIC